MFSTNASRTAGSAGNDASTEGAVPDRATEPSGQSRDRAERAARALRVRYAGLAAGDLLAATIKREFPGRIAVVSSFGAESAVVLDLVAAIDPATPVIFLDTGKHFEETIRYRDALRARLGLSDVRSVRPDPRALAERDPTGALWRRDPDACCRLRRVEALARALQGFEAWITGRKRFQGEARSALEAIEPADGRIKINPLADWPPAAITEHFRERALPAHPLVADGYLSIGCMPCTGRVRPGEDARSGRWRGSTKTECGIHRSG